MSDNQFLIGGIQQIGVGVADLDSAFGWYRQQLGMDIPVFDDDGEANLMLPYTGGEGQRRHAILAANMQGGSAFEIWQYKSRVPQAPSREIQLGDLGIHSSRIKSRDVDVTHDFLLARGVTVMGEPSPDPSGSRGFFFKDPGGLVHQIVEGTDWFRSGPRTTGGVVGCIIGVSDVERSRALYTGILGYDEVVYDVTGRYDDLKVLLGGDQEVRRVLLTHKAERKGPFSRWLGRSQIELVQVMGRKPSRMFEGRFWGDLGFIHLCFDVVGMAPLKEACTSRGFPFTVDSASSFDMGEAAGHFSYVEDPDGTLIEFVETHKIPIARRLGLYVNLQKRRPGKPLPDWMVKTLAWNRIKD